MFAISLTVNEIFADEEKNPITLKMKVKIKELKNGTLSFRLEMLEVEEEIRTSGHFVRVDSICLSVCPSTCPCGYPSVVRPSIRPSGRPSDVVKCPSLSYL